MGKLENVLADTFREMPYWWDSAPPEQRHSAALPETVDVAIIGAGYCGLCAGLELAENNVNVAVLDAEELGAGASTRNGGMVTGGQKFIVSGAIKGLNSEQIAHVLDDARESLEWLEARLHKYALDADYQRQGRLILAHTPRQYQRLEEWAKLLQKRDAATVSLVPLDRQREEIGSDHYFGGLRIDHYGGLHPAKYHRALRQAAARHGASLNSHAQVTGIACDGSGFVVNTMRGKIQAREVFVATNGYTGSLIPYLQRRVIPVASYLIATERLPEGLAARLSPRGRMFSDTRRDLRYFRLSPDGTRFVFGGRPGLRRIGTRAAATRLHRMAAQIFQDLNDVGVEFAWQGNVAMSFDHIPHMGRYKGIHYALGCNGSGVAMMSYLGIQMAQKLLGTSNRRCAFDGLEFPRMPLYTGVPWFLPIVSGWYRADDYISRIGR